jgi:NAD(P)-dependent dehydrogenase (short-subunit alcohol dehydrogenase family)
MGIQFYKRKIKKFNDLKNTFEELATNNFSLEGQRGIVTGGSSGIGKAIAIMLANAGAEVFAFSRTGKFKNSKDEIENLHHLKANITDKKDVKDKIDAIGMDGLDFVVNNAGVTSKQKMVDLDLEKWDQVQEVNVKAAMNIARFAFQYITKAKKVGRIVNITSMAAYIGFNDVVPYAVSKTALLGLTRGLSVEWANENVLVNSVSPGWIKTNMVVQVLDPKREEKILNKMPLHKYGTPEDIASMVWYLVAPASKYITGQDFPVDGGTLAFGY